MATVYLADDLKHERKVALKVLKPELAAVVAPDPGERGLIPSVASHRRHEAETAPGSPLPWRPR